MEDEEKGVEDKKYTAFSIAVYGGRWRVVPEERYLDENGTERTRWVSSKNVYFDNLDGALAYLKLCEGQFLD